MSADPSKHPVAAHSFTLAEVWRIIGVAFVAGGAVTYLLANYHDDTLEVLARIVGIVASLTLVFMIFEARRRRQIDRVRVRLDRIEALLSRATYWRMYADVMSDLGGIDGEDSTDSGQLPPRN